MITLKLTGKLVRLAQIDLEKDPESFASWNRDSEYQRLLDTRPAFLFSPAAIRSYLEKKIGKDDILFSIRPLEDDRTVGFIELDGFDWQARSAWTAIGIGEAAYRGRGLGTDAMRVMIRFGFEQLNLNRITLNVFEYNQRALHSYEKCGYVEEGRTRQMLNRETRRWDLVYMGLLKEDWLARQLAE
jgi:RimJ/RimL family protein N-acetyltransferase